MKKITAIAKILSVNLGIFSLLTGSAAAADLYLSPNGNDANSCAQSAPCKSFDRAYKAAQPGQVVEAAAGTYGGQSIGADASKTSANDVVFQPAAGAAVIIGNINGGLNI